MSRSRTYCLIVHQPGTPLPASAVAIVAAISAEFAAITVHFASAEQTPLTVAKMVRAAITYEMIRGDTIVGH